MKEQKQDQVLRALAPSRKKRKIAEVIRSAPREKAGSGVNIDNPRANENDDAVQYGRVSVV